jgi:hypothetical protein
MVIFSLQPKFSAHSPHLSVVLVEKTQLLTDYVCASGSIPRGFSAWLIRHPKRLQRFWLNYDVIGGPSSNFRKFKVTNGYGLPPFRVFRQTKTLEILQSLG